MSLWFCSAWPGSEVARRVGITLDEVQLVPPRTILRTSSGKVRRAETRAAFVAGALVRPTASCRFSLARAVVRSIWQLSVLRARQVAVALRLERLTSET